MGGSVLGQPDIGRNAVIEEVEEDSGETAYLADTSNPSVVSNESESFVISGGNVRER